ncbi:MAG: SusC/RagA family TonB-linked outer membrane protein [Tannerella sp.]|nr:SusC/RagA family TonB-linked outer membrane protein [Tannerella sp.]
MRLSALLLFLGMLSVSAENTYSQNARVTINQKNARLDNILSEIEKQTDYLFLYTNEVEVAQRTSVKAKGEPVSQVLNDLFSNTHINYVMEGSHIILTNKSTQKNGVTQSKTITGKITDSTGEALIGVSILVKGTTNGTITDVDGNFTINAAVGQTLEISYIGYTTQDITITSSTNKLNIVLANDVIAIDEVVVTALGIQRSQKALSYNVQELKGEELLGVKDVNFMNSLSGKVAGVNISASSAGVGGATRVVMRGAKSISKDNNALYVIDGVPIFNTSKGELDQKNEYAGRTGTEGISDLNPEDIESISVLTGPAAAALYGSNAANGAIIITTKRGAAGKPKVTLSNQTTFTSPFVMPDFQNRYANADGSYKSWSNNLGGTTNYDPADFFETGTTVQTTASVSVGSDKSQSYVSLGATNANGMMPNNAYNKYNATFRNTTKFLDDKMTLDFGFSYIKQNDKNMVAQGQYYNPLVSAYTYPRGASVSDLKTYEKYDEAKAYNVQQWQWGSNNLGMQNPYWILYRNVFQNKRDRYMMNASLKYDILDWLNVAGRVRLDNANAKETQKNYATTDQLFAGENGQYKSGMVFDKQTYADFLVNINKYWEEISFVANIGTSISDIRNDAQSTDGSLMIPNFFAITNINRTSPTSNINQSGWHEQTQSVFANVEMGWRSMLYLTLTGRNDWASALANTKNSSFFYPSVGLSGIVTEMIDMPDFLSYMQVRGSYSSVGSPIPRNLSVATYPFDAQGGVWSTNTYKPVDELKPEKTNSWEAGLSTKFWGNRLSLDFTWYKSNTKNQTLNIPISASSGYTSMYVQTGNVQNTGIEFSLGSENKFGGLIWSSSFTATYNQNKIVQLIEEGKFFDPSGEAITLDKIGQGGIGASEFRLTKGGTMGDFWTEKRLKRDDNGTIVLAEDGSPVLENEWEKQGSVLPKWNLGFRNDFYYKNINLGFLVSARLGGIVVSPTQAILDGFGVSETTAKVRDNGGKVVIDGVSMDAEKYYNVVGQAQGLLRDYTYSATNVRLQEISLGYTLPSSWFNNVMKMNVSVIARNLWMIYNKAPFDPETTASTGTYYQGIDYFMQPSARSIGFNVRVEF